AAMCRKVQFSSDNGARLPAPRLCTRPSLAGDRLQELRGVVVQNRAAHPAADIELHEPRPRDLIDRQTEADAVDEHIRTAPIAERYREGIRGDVRHLFPGVQRIAEQAIR